MIEIRRILCPIDFSDHSRRALDHAMAIARWYESTVTVLHVLPLTPASAVGAGPVVFEPVVMASIDRDQVLAAVNTFAGPAAGVPVEPVLRDGNVAAEILEQASAMDADLLVLGTHGRSGFERLVLGSVAEKTLRKAGCPVLTVPKADVKAGGPAPVLYKSILCPVDFSESSMRALTYATSLAQEADARLVVAHVVAYEFDDLPETSVLDDAARTTVAGFLSAHEADVRRRLAERLAGVDEFCSVEPLVLHGRPWREILRVAAERHSDVIVMGVQGRRAVDRFFFGSTTQHVVRDASCPVLTLRHG